ncbi:Heterokaryon incompatibility [Apiospora kogelbergensis]|uniref:Heterokaryon incompatibility n=1 Tax=Apiospora kogelbergensis TaxID=1337665 RepID=UPI0031322055
MPLPYELHLTSGGVSKALDSLTTRISDSQSTAYPDIFDTASMWLTRRFDSHDQCQHAKDLEYPRRLVSIGSDIVRLIETSSPSVKPLYTTLSYCWGQDDFTVFTMETLAPFQRDIPVPNLAQTLQGTIYVARRLGMDYIWIDALWTIQRQSGYSDWMYESSRMRPIYGGSYINIAISSAADSSQGFLSQSGVEH